MSNSTPSSRPTLRSIAESLGVTPATVSLALRDSPEISGEMRARVKAAAAALGYHPDPELGKLMHRLRATREPRYRSTLCALSDLAPHEHPRVRRLLEGARHRASELGFALHLEPWPAAGEERAKLRHVLANRGIEGLLLLPTREAAHRFEEWGDWSEFSVVATTRHPQHPDFDRVVEHYYWSIQQIVAELAALGCRRIGLIYSAAFNHSINHKLAAASAHRDCVPGIEHIGAFSYGDAHTLAPAPSARVRINPPAASATARARPGPTLEAWFAREQPGALVLDHEAIAATVRQRLRIDVPGRVVLATLNREPDSPLAGIDERWHEIGATAVSLLSQKILRGERGSPPAPMVTMVKGRWVPAPSAPATVFRLGGK